MAISLEEAKAVLGRGESEGYLLRFIETAIKNHLAALLGEVPDSQDVDDAYIVALAIAEVLDLREVRQTWGLKRIPRGEKYRVDDLVDLKAGKDEALKVAEDLIDGKINRETALDKLETLTTDYYGAAPKNDKTLNRLLDDLVARARWLQEQLEVMVLRLGNGNPTIAEQVMRSALTKREK